VADDSWEDVRALARKRAERGLTGVCMLPHTVYSFLLSYVVPARFVNKNLFSLAPFPLITSGESDTFGHCRVKAAHSTRDPTIDLMRSPTFKQTAAADKHR